MTRISRVPSRRWDRTSDRTTSSVTSPPALRSTCACPNRRPSAGSTSILASMHVSTTRRRSGGAARPPDEKSHEYVRLAARASSTADTFPASPGRRPGGKRRPGAVPRRYSGRQALVGRVVVAGEEGAQLVDHPVERRGGEEHRLVLGDVVVERAHGAQVPRAHLGGPEHLDLAVGRQQPRAVGPQLAVLVQDAELEREPED